MRKYLYAGAVAGGFLLLGAAPAHADVQPAPAGAQQDAGALGSLLGSSGDLDQADGLGISDPLGGSGGLLGVKPGNDSADVPGAAGSLVQAPAARTGLGRAGERITSGSGRPSAEALPDVGGAGLPTGALGGLPVSNLLRSGLIGNLLPNGPGFARADQESGLFGGELPLLLGLLPDTHSIPAASSASGLPAGGTAVSPAQKQPVQAKPAAPAAAEDPATANDPRLHEEPTDAVGKGSSRRAFSAGRPVAGADPDYR